MVPNHATQTDPYLHEIKGASTATLGQVPIANGSGGAPFGALPTGGGGSVVKTTVVLSNTTLTGTTLIPFDNTIPQLSEGNNVFTVNWTPTGIGNGIRITAVIFGAYSVAANVTAALFQDSTANAVAAVATQTTVANQSFSLELVWQVTAPSLTAIAFKLQLGGSTAGTLTINGNSGTAIFGGVAASSLIITEIKA